VTPPGDELFGLLAEVVAEHHPGAVAVPTVTPGFTDAKFWSALGTACYGFAPVRLEPGDPDFAAMFHADNERIPVAGLAAGLRMLADTVARHCC
jgi:acetylornithine deacetylase/succinyl-diaminopimelate desuccinylase-like protein